MFGGSVSMLGVLPSITNSTFHTYLLDLIVLVSVELAPFERESAALGRGIEVPRDLHFKAFSMALAHFYAGQESFSSLAYSAYLLVLRTREDGLSAH